MSTGDRLMTVGDRLRTEVEAAWRSARLAVRQSGPERDTMTQALKAAGAAIAAWALTGWWLKAPLALLAPWTALALVEATVYRSLRSGVQQLGVIMAGTLWASAAMAMTGGNTLGAMVIALPVLVLFGTYRRLGAQGLYGATTALFVITYGAYSLDEVGHRLLECLIGAVIGIGVNALVLPPVHLRSVHERLLRLMRESAELLETMAGSLREEWSAADAAQWHDRARRLEQLSRELAEARQWTAESARANPGWRLRRVGAPPPAEEDVRWTRVAGHLTAITRSLEGTAGEEPRLVVPESAFLSRYADLVAEVASLCAVAERSLRGERPDQAEARRSRDRAWALYDQFVDDFQHHRFGATTVSGALLVESKQLLYELAPDTDRGDAARDAGDDRDQPGRP
ncbi:hypothetical protein H8N01_29820 [Streptomyces sp. AC536]|uniref:FUSC family protein n=1 Tax=Streptomyces buecherae TaxID=2763006 RepID=UPI00164ED895|nr:hypothetical protein [Streptomyces buecherae]MBC3986667.1 hypothetical protein [Streptomyces buecherae]QNJ43013.1 hypothetical protein H7H31_27440 [Streptomyces buecherae]